MKRILIGAAFAFFGVAVHSATLPKLPDDFPTKWEKYSSETCTPKAGVVLVMESYRQKNVVDDSLGIITIGKKNGILVNQVNARITKNNVIQHGYVLNGKSLRSFNPPISWSDFAEFTLATRKAYGLTKAEFATCK